MKVWWLVSLCCFGCFTELYAEIHSQSGTGIFPFLGTEMDARAAAMGRTGVMNSSSTNPALLAELRNSKISFVRILGVQDINDNFVSYQQYCGKYPVLVGLFSRGSDLGDSYNEDGIKIPAIETSDMVFLASVAKEMVGYRYFLFWGIEGKIIRSKIGGYKASGVGIDTGFLFKFSQGDFYNIPLKNLKLGLVLQNVGPQARGSPLPFTLKLGGNYQSTDKFLLALEFKKPRDDFLSMSVGGEYQYDGIFSFQAGYVLGNERGISCGLGVNHKNLQVNYAVNQGALENIHRISLSYEFKEVEK